MFTMNRNRRSLCTGISRSDSSFRQRAPLDSEPFKPVAIEFSGQLEQQARSTRGVGPIQEQVVLPLFLKASEPLHPFARDDTEDVGQIARAKASRDRQLHRLVEPLLLPPLLDPVAGHRLKPLVRPTAATAFAEYDLPKNAAAGRSQWFVTAERFADALSLSIHGRAFLVGWMRDRTRLAENTNGMALQSILMRSCFTSRPLAKP